MYDTHILIQSDNSTTVAYLNHMGGCKSTTCNQIAKEIWLWCKNKQLENLEADHESRNFNDRTEWQLNPKIFSIITTKLGNPTIDMFASRLNKQLNRYVSWRPDPGATFVVAFTCDWSCDFNYMFPPFSLVSRTLKKMREDEATAILIVPYWPTQPWFALMLHMLTHPVILLPRSKKTLQLPFAPEKNIPSCQKNNALCMSFIRKSLHSQKFSKRFESVIMSSWRTTTKKQYQTYYQKWQKFTCERQIDSLHPPLNQVLDFLADLFESGLRYSALNTARSALSTFISVNIVPVGSHPHVKRFMKGVFEQRPSVPQYKKT